MFIEPSMFNLLVAAKEKPGITAIPNCLISNFPEFPKEGLLKLVSDVPNPL